MDSAAFAPKDQERLAGIGQSYAELRAEVDATEAASPDQAIQGTGRAHSVMR